jgi:MFS family permease
VLREFGFRSSLIVGGLLGAGGYAACGLFRPGWPVAAIFAVLAASGFFMSFQFTAYNTIAYDEIPPERMSAATSFYATFQQLMLSLGICVGALSLHLGMAARARNVPLLNDFTLAFVVVTVVSASATIWNARFSADAGDELSGRKAVSRAGPVEA